MPDPPRAQSDRDLCARLFEAHRSSSGWAGDVGDSATALTLFQYPAMMPASLPRDVTTTLLEFAGPGQLGPVFDPFVGSGTTITAAMRLGLDVVGWDVNPLAILICRVKSGPFYAGELAEAVSRTLVGQPSAKVDERFPNWRHWFTTDVARGLTSLRGRILAERKVAIRRFLWLCLAETVRLTSNSRTSTVKLHRREHAQILRRPDPRVVFARIASTNLERLESFRIDLERRGLLARGVYTGAVTLRLGDSRLLPWSGGQSKLLLTSPPYGDNRSTVSYGQHAYLPLQWIDLGDIDRRADAGCLSSTYEIDRRSLGGERRVADLDRDRLSRASQALAGVLEQLSAEKRDRQSRVLAFARDLDAVLEHVSGAVSAGAPAVFIVGSRRVAGRVVPLARILVDLAASHGLEHLTTLDREIPLHRKRMARRTSVSETMHREHLLVLRRA